MTWNSPKHEVIMMQENMTDIRLMPRDQQQQLQQQMMMMGGPQYMADDM